VTLAINLSNCPHRCVGCHSPHLRSDIGEALTEAALAALISKYENSITCVCFMGGDAVPDELCHLAGFIRESWNGNIKTALVLGQQQPARRTSQTLFRLYQTRGVHPVAGRVE